MRGCRRRRRHAPRCRAPDRRTACSKTQLHASLPRSTTTTRPPCTRSSTRASRRSVSKQSCDDLILPTLTRVGLEWQQGTLAISQEHFASNLIRARLLSLARLWGRGSGPLALLACAPGEQHDITLLSFGLLLRSYGWRILFLGADTPIATLTEAAETTRPALTVLASFDPDLLETEASALRRLAKRVPLVLSGPGASDALCTQLGVRRLDGDLIRAATEIGHTTYD